MEFVQNITIHAPSSDVIELFSNPYNMRFWLPHVSEIEMIGRQSEGIADLGVRCSQGYPSYLSLTFNQSDKKNFSAHFGSPASWIHSKYHFEAVSENQTKLTVESSIGGEGFIFWLTRRANLRVAQENSQENLHRLKDFVERYGEQKQEEGYEYFSSMLFFPSTIGKTKTITSFVPLPVGLVKCVIWLESDNEVQRTHFDRADSVLKWLTLHMDSVKTYIAEKLLSLANDWRAEGGEEVPLSKQEFMSNMSLAHLHLYENGKITISFDDKDMFSGHWIDVQLDGNFQFLDCSI